MSILTITALLVLLSFSFSLAAPVEKGKGLKKKSTEDDFRRDINILRQAVTTLYEKYEKKFTSQEMVYTLIKEYVKSLDPYTHFIEKKESEEMGIRLKGEYGGLGIVISIRDEILTVVSPLEDTPAERAGVEAMDRIIKIDDEFTRGITLEEAVNKMRGVPGTLCILTIKRKDEVKPLIFDLTRAVIHLKSVKSRMFDEKYGYVRIVNFSRDTGKDLRENLLTLKKDNPKGLILDLRSNPGGLLQGAVEVSSMFLPKDDLVVYTQGRIPSSNAKYYTNQEPIFPKIPLIVLINQGSASASEIVSGAIRDNKRGILLGMKSFGKGSVQHIFPLLDGSSLVVTVSKYYTPSGVVIHEKGLTPDVVIEIPKKKKETTEKDELGEEDPEKEDNFLKDIWKEQEEEERNNHDQDDKQEEPAEEGTEEEELSEEEKLKKENAEILERDYQLKKALELLDVSDILGGK